MRSSIHFATLSVGLISFTLLAAGCRRGEDVEGSPTQQAREALGVKEAGKERTVESKRSVIVEDTKKVIDAQTGEVLKTQETRTPVTVTEQKTVEHDVNVKPGRRKRRSSEGAPSRCVGGDAGMQIRRSAAADTDALVDIWLRSVHATHDFLTEDDILSLLPLVWEFAQSELEILDALLGRRDSDGIPGALRVEDRGALPRAGVSTSGIRPAFRAACPGAQGRADGRRERAESRSRPLL